MSCPDCRFDGGGVFVMHYRFRQARKCVVNSRMVTSCLQVGIVLVGEGHLGSLGHLLLVSLHGGLVDGDLWGSKGGCGDEFL
jgi:hypothetical protein